MNGRINTTLDYEWHHISVANQPKQYEQPIPDNI